MPKINPIYKKVKYYRENYVNLDFTYNNWCDKQFHPRVLLFMVKLCQISK